MIQITPRIRILVAVELVDFRIGMLWGMGERTLRMILADIVADHTATGVRGVCGLLNLTASSLRAGQAETQARRGALGGAWRGIGRCGLAREVGVQKKLFDFGARPRGFTKEGQAGFDARVRGEAADVDTATQFLPAVVGDQLGEQRLQRDGVKRIVLLRWRHGGRGGSN